MYKSLIGTELNQALFELVKSNKEIVLKNIDRKLNENFVELRTVKVEETDKEIVIYYGAI